MYKGLFKISKKTHKNPTKNTREGQPPRRSWQPTLCHLSPHQVGVCHQQNVAAVVIMTDRSSFCPGLCLPPHATLSKEASGHVASPGAPWVVRVCRSGQRSAGTEVCLQPRQWAWKQTLPDSNLLSDDSLTVTPWAVLGQNEPAQLLLDSRPTDPVRRQMWKALMY